MVEANNPFEKIALRWINDAITLKPSQIPDIVYHYTDAAGLIGMLNSGQIWMTDYRFLNDKTEYTHTTKVSKSVISELLKKEPTDTQSRLYSTILAHEELEEPTASFVFSLSQRRDDLSQWRGYAREGEGFTLGLSGEALCEASCNDENGFNFASVEYELATQSRVLQRALQDIEKQIAVQLNKPDADLDEILDDAARAFVWLRRNRGALNKHHSFRGEMEWRLVSYLTHDEPTKVRSSGPRLVRYVEFDVSVARDSRLPLVEIGIGPGFSGAEKAAVESLCRNHDYTPEIYFADTPYRQL